MEAIPHRAEVPQRSEQNDEINLLELIRVLWAAKWWIFASGIFAAVISIAVVKQLPNIYKSEAVLSPVSDAKVGGLASVAGQLGGLASLAGISLGGMSGVDKVVSSIETLKSRIFLTDFINRHQLLIPIMAAKGWDLEKQEWIIDPEIYDTQQEVWVRKVNPPLLSKPSDLEAFKVFSKMIAVNQDGKTQIVNLSVESLSPVYAKKWAQELIRDVNEYIREKDVGEAKRSITYLTREIEATSVAQIQSVLFQMIEEQKKTVMLAAVRDGYAFQVIDPPVVPEEKVSPRRASIVVMSVMGAFIIAVGGVLVLAAYRNAGRRSMLVEGQS